MILPFRTHGSLSKLTNVKDDLFIRADVYEKYKSEKIPLKTVKNEL